MIIEKNKSNNIQKFTERRSKLLYGFLRNYNSRATQEAYRADLELFLKFLLKQFHKTEFSFEHAHAVAYKEFLIEKKYNTNSVNRKLAAASAFIEYLVIEGARVKNPFDRIRRFPKANIGKTSSISLMELRAALDKINRKKIIGKMRLALLMVLFNTGMRVSEVCNLKLRSFQTDEIGVYLYFKIKGGSWHKTYLPDETIRVLYDYLSERKKIVNDLKIDEFLFVSHSNNSANKLNRSSVNYIFKHVFKESANKIHPHVSRATFITEVIKKKGISSAQKRVGHLDPRTTTIYDKGNELGHVTVI